MANQRNGKVENMKRYVSIPGRWGTLLLACLFVGSCISLWLGQDGNWDLRNYHVYNPWAFLNGRGDIDLFAAGIQTYFNPLLDLPYYLLAFEWWSDKPRAVAFLSGLPYGLLIFAVICCAYFVLTDLGLAPGYRAVAVVLTTAFGVTGAATLPQVGTTFNEIQIASLIVSGVAILLYGLRENGRPFRQRFAFWGGILFGLAAGFKLTASIYAPAAAIALFVVAQHKPKAIVTMAVFSIGWALGFALTYGWWAYQLYMSTGNPVFPMLEGIFGTQGLGTGNWMDNKFKPKSSTQALLFPFFWIDAAAPTVAEPIFSDPRFAVALFAMLGFACLFLLSRLGRPACGRADSIGKGFPATATFVLVFTIIGYTIWLKVFSILRYAVPIEALLGISTAILIIAVCTRFLHIALSEKALLVCLSLLLLGVAAKTKYPQWGRVPYGDTVLRVQPVKLAPHTMLVAIGSPQAFVLPSIARQNPTVQFVGITDDLMGAHGFDLWKQVMGKISQFPGDMYVMVRVDQIGRLDMLPQLKLHADKNHCQIFGSNLDSDFTICPLYKAEN